MEPNTSSKTPTATKKERAYKAKRHRRQATGLVVLTLSAIGVISIVLFGVRFIAGLFDDSKDKERYAALVAPLVALDPAPFNSIEQADKDVLLQSAIWAALTNEGTEKYDYDADTGQLLLPAVDVGKYATKMYGSQLTLEHRTFTGLGLTFTYNADSGMYLVPATSLGGSYIPYVESITTSGNTRTLRVVYTQATSSELALDPNLMIRSKYMDYVLIKTGGDYYIYALHEIEG